MEKPTSHWYTNRGWSLGLNGDDPFVFVKVKTNMKLLVEPVLPWLFHRRAPF
jgi:hypothetical protein